MSEKSDIIDIHLNQDPWCFYAKIFEITPEF